MYKFIIKFIVKYFYRIRYLCATGSPIYALAYFSVETGANLPSDYVWGERYMNWVEYLRRRGNGIQCTYQDVENEFLDDWRKDFEDAKKRFWEEREKHGHDWWV